MSAPDLNKEFFVATLRHVRDREEKQIEITRHLRSFLTAMTKMPGGMHHMTLKLNTLFEGTGKISGIFERDHYQAQNLRVDVSPSGRVRMILADNTQIFDFDDYSPQETVAKILTTLASMDNQNSFSEFLTQTMQKIWTEDLVCNPDYAPGAMKGTSPATAPA